ncbi:uncharacterized protein LOC130680522 isoform X1 [Manis pentadactyla]|uniref:uncharacterized protein LOC130680522 isoform X1 n=1 Tax=Manis pentadactyla TaxID=143292 RepID=UPI00255C3DE1|nr:uncharacterized protein LOC130680522 isoform X1 [Manis pentadactyla]
MLVPPAGTARFRCPPCFFPKVLSQTQQRKLPACARPLVSPAPPPPPSLAKAQAPSNSDRLRLPPAGSRGLPRQGPAPSSSRRPVLLAAAAHGAPREAAAGGGERGLQWAAAWTGCLHVGAWRLQLREARESVREADLRGCRWQVAQPEARARRRDAGSAVGRSVNRLRSIVGRGVCSCGRRGCLRGADL